MASDTDPRCESCGTWTRDTDADGLPLCEECMERSINQPVTDATIADLRERMAEAAAENDHRMEMTTGEVERLLRQMERLRADAERMDWMSESEAQMMIEIDDSDNRVGVRVEHVGGETTGKSLREAIDRAMRAERAWDAARDAAAKGGKDAAAEVERLRAIVAQVDDALVVCDIVASNGDYREAIHRLVGWHIMVENDPRVSKSAAERQAEIERLRNTLRTISLAATQTCPTLARVRKMAAAAAKGDPE